MAKRDDYRGSAGTRIPQPDVKVHLTQGCELCGETGKHTRTQADWRDLIDRSDPFRRK